VQALLTEIATESEPIIFNGDGYSAEWHAEAAKRGLLNLKTSAEALGQLKEPAVEALFEKYNVLSKRELESRFDTYVEQYCKTVNVEANVTIEMAKTMIFPAAIRYQGELAATAANLKYLDYKFDTDTLDAITELVKSLQDSVAILERLVADVPHQGGQVEATYYCTEVLPAMAVVRKYADALEGMIADDIWPLPTYQEMLFIK
jgi:glutamine synthetase